MTELLEIKVAAIFVIRKFSEPNRLVPKFAAALAGVVLIAIVSVWA